MKKLSTENKFTLQGIIIASLLGVISVFLGFIFMFVFKLYNNSVDLNTNVATVTVKVENQSKIQTTILDKQVEHDEAIRVLKHKDNVFTYNLDTIKVSIADLRNGFINHEGRIIRLEKDHYEQ